MAKRSSKEMEKAGWSKQEVEVNIPSQKSWFISSYFWYQASRIMKANLAADERLWKALTPDMNWGITHPATLGLAVCCGALFYYNGVTPLTETLIMETHSCRNNSDPDTCEKLSLTVKCCPQKQQEKRDIYEAEELENEKVNSLIHNGQRCSEALKSTLFDTAGSVGAYFSQEEGEGSCSTRGPRKTQKASDRLMYALDLQTPGSDARQCVHECVHEICTTSTLTMTVSLQ